MPLHAGTRAERPASSHCCYLICDFRSAPCFPPSCYTKAVTQIIATPRRRESFVCESQALDWTGVRKEESCKYMCYQSIM